MPQLTERDIDRLALDACEFIGWKSGSTVAYDPAGFDRAERIQVAPGSLHPRSADLPARPAPLPLSARFDPQPYPARIAGFQRRAIFGPDEIGKLIASYGIPWNDGLGNGLYESLRIDRKYGLKHVLEAPIYGYTLPFLPEDWAAFKHVFAQEIQRLKRDLKELEPIYGAPLAESGKRLMILWSQHYPLGLFAEAYFRNPVGVEADLLKEIGMPTPPVQPATPAERAAQARFWCLARARQVQISAYQAGALRQALGEGLQIASNPHELPPLDMEGQGRAFDYPAVAIRPLLVEDEVMLRHYIAFYTQLYHDLTGKAPMVSVRMNTSAASPRFIPRASLIHAWYNQAVRHGAGAFYFWTRDYPYYDAPGAYDGPIPGNPDPSAIAPERWQAVLDLLGKLCASQRFLPPVAEVAILVPNESALLHRPEWRRLYATFGAFCEASIHTRFISDRLIAAQGVPAGVKVLVAPALEFVSAPLRAGLEQFIGRGGSLLRMNAPLRNETGEPAPRLSGAHLLDPALFDVFPLGQPGSLARLQALAQALRERVSQAKADPQAWVFDVCVENLPASAQSLLRAPEPDLRFDPWLYEHGSPWIVPYL